MSLEIKKTDNQGVIVGYVVIGTVAILTLFHMGSIAIILAIAAIIVIESRIQSQICDISKSHFKWQKNTALILVVSLGLLISWFLYEMVHIGSDSFFSVIAVHWVIHTIVSIISAIWILFRTIKGVVRYSKQQPI